MKPTARASPYLGEPEEAWLEITRGLLATHPLKVDSIREVALTAWAKVWDTTVGSGDTAIRLAELGVPATVVGYFFEVLLARELQHLYPDDWRGNRSGDEKDVVYIKDLSLSIEMKSSGQLGDRVYGNRSYGQRTQNEDLVKKEKSGYYITANFYGQTLTLLRFGWIDASDWKPQASPTGQMAGLSVAVYAKKLIAIPGEYQLDAPVELLEGVGPKIATEFLTKSGRFANCWSIPADFPQLVRGASWRLRLRSIGRQVRQVPNSVRCDSTTRDNRRAMNSQ